VYNPKRTKNQHINSDIKSLYVTVITKVDFQMEFPSPTTYASFKFSHALLNIAYIYLDGSRSDRLMAVFGNSNPVMLQCLHCS